MSKIYKGLAANNEVSVAVIDATSLVGEAIVRHGLSPVAAAALGRTMIAGAYLCSWLKSAKSVLHITVSGGGPGGKITVSGDGALHMRGSIDEPSVDLPLRADGKLDVGGCVGKNGILSVVRDDGEGVPFVGASELISGEIAEDFSAYFLTSEQRPTAIALGVRVSNSGECLGAGGVFLQPLPGAGEQSIAFAEREIARYADVSRLIAERGAKRILGDLGAEGSWRKISFRCHCNRGRAAAAVRSMGRTGAEELLKERGQICVHCHDCNTDYLFGEGDLAELFPVGKGKK